jgi:hypothetical protein
MIDRGTCAGTVSYKGNSTTQCKRTAASQDANGTWWCGLHHPEKVKEKEARKAAQDALKAEAAAKPFGGLPGHEPKPEIIERVIADETVHGLVDASKAAMVVLHAIAQIKDVGWPENTPAAKYAILLADINVRALKAGDELRDEIAKVKLSS